MELAAERSSSRGHHHSPSFSSTLLDAIYRSIDEGPHPQQQHFISHHQTLKRGVVLKEQDGNSNYQRNCMIEKWMEKKGSRKVENIPRTYRNSSSSSSDSSSKAGFSSSESEHSTPNKTRYSTSCYSIKKLKPIRTDTVLRPQTTDKYCEPKPNPSYNKPQIKASKIYGEIKRSSLSKNRDPISPGAKLTSFLNSIFNAKKAKGENFSKSGHSSTCSSASSFSRSCLSKNNNVSVTKGKLGETRSVRFCPNVSEVLGGNKDHVPNGHKQEPLSRRSREEAENMLRNYQKKRSEINNVEEDDDDDGASCASSDLFELDHLSGVGVRFDEELPLYETTNLKVKNTANAFIM